MEARSNMKNTHYSMIRRAFREESGQIIMPWVAVLMLSFLGVAGLTLDVGRAYIAHAQLQNAANAAALAAAGEVYNTSTTNDAYAFATSYSGSSGDRNRSGVGTVTTTVYEGCANSLMPTGTSCTSSSPKNAVQVVQSTSVRNYIMPIFWGTRTTNISAAATASMQGASKPWNIAIILDSTGSMGNPSNSTSCPGYSTNYSCALWGIRTFLQDVRPCADTSNCTSGTAKVRVALFSFPNVSTATAADYWDCNSTKPTNEPYTLPKSGISKYTTLSYSGTTTIPTSTYEATPVNTDDGDANGFVYDYWSASSSNYLSTSSDLSKEVGGVSGCSSMTNPGGENTYYAGVIYAAQAALTAENTANGYQNALIILSDGQAQAGCDKFPGYRSSGTGADTVSSTTYGYSTSNNCSGTTNLASTTKGLYPDFHNDCQQAITAAQAAQAAGTLVVTVAFGAESNGCYTGSGGTDGSITATATSGQPALSLSDSGLSPCVAMKNMASPASTLSNNIFPFYVDASSTSNGCTASQNTLSGQSIANIFAGMAGTIFTHPKMLANSTFTYGVAQSS